MRGVGGDEPPGTIVALRREGILVAVGDGAVVVSEVKPAGGREMPAVEYVRGHNVRSGDRFQAES